MRSRFLHELTTPEVEAYLAGGGDIALLPVGCVEMHGPHQPIGTDTLVAKAFSLALAERIGALVLPEVHYTWAGATDGFAGTISIPPELAQQLVETIVTKAYDMGFKRIMIMSIHGPNRMVMALTARRLFEKLGAPVGYLDCYPPATPEAAELFAGDLEAAKEASLVLAAMEILGQGDLYAESEMAYADQAPEMPRSYWDAKPALVGYYMQDPRQHACPSEHVSIELGRKFFAVQLDRFEQIAASIAQYAKDVEAQANTGSPR